MADGGSPAVSVHGLRKTYDRRAVLSDVSFTVGRGELVAVLGPNGAGKTTTLEIVEGYRRADGGEVRVLGLDPARDGARLRPRVGLMLQDGGVDPRTTPREVLRLFARLHADPADADLVLETCGLAPVARTRYRRLSGGERQRLALGLALVGRPELLILDEPTAGMDPAAKVATRELIRGLRATGSTILLTTHDLADVEQLADRIVVLDRGRIVAAGTPAELTAGDRPHVRFRLREPLADQARVALEARLARVTSDDVRIVDLPLDRHVVEGPAATPAVLAALTEALASEGLLVRELDTAGGSLEERYLELVGRSDGFAPERERALRL